MKLLLTFISVLALPPYALGQTVWTQHTPVNYSRAKEIFRDNRGILYAYGLGIGIETHVSTDNGETWHRKSLRPGSFTAGRGDTVYFQTSDSIYVTTAGLENFKNLALMPGEIFFHPSGTLFVHKKGEYLNRSFDGGKTWVEVKPSLDGASGADLFAIDKQGRLLASSSNRFYVSSDLGDTWTHSEPAITSGDRFQQLLVTTHNRYFLIAALSVQVSTDAGTTWSINKQSLDEWENIRADSNGRIIGRRHLTYLALQNGRIDTLFDSVGVISITSDGRIWMMESGGRLGYLKEGTRNIVYSDNGFKNYDIKGALRFADGEYYFILDHGIHAFSKDLTNWEIVHDSWDFGFNNGSIVDVRLAPDGSVFGISRTYGRDLYRSTTQGRTWESFMSLPLNEDLVGIDSIGNIYTGARRIASDRTRQLFELPTIEQDEFDVNAQGKIVASRDQAISITTDDGSTWTDIAVKYWSPYQVRLIDQSRTMAVTYSGLQWIEQDDVPWLEVDPADDLSLYQMIPDNLCGLYAIGRKYQEPAAIYQLDRTTLEPEFLIEVPDGLYLNHIMIHNGLLVAGSSDGLYSARLPNDQMQVHTQPSSPTEVMYHDGKIQFANTTDATTLVIYDALGRVVEQQSLMVGASDALVGSLTPGIYHFNLPGATKSKSAGKFIVRP